MGYVRTMNTSHAWMLKQIRKLPARLSALALSIMALALIGLVVLGITYLQQRRDQDAVASKIEAARQSLGEYGDDASRQRQWAAAEAELAAEEASFPSRLSGPSALGAVIQLAEESGLRVMDVRTQPRRKQQVGEHTYHALSMSVQVEGALPALTTFVSKVESGVLQAAKVDELSITAIEQPPAVNPEFSRDGAAAREVQSSLTASLDFSVYARETSLP